MAVERSYWDPAYLSGEFKSKWDFETPSQELIGVLATLNLPLGSQILDIGCGSGTDVCYLHGIGYNAIGTDFSLEGLRIARERSAAEGLQTSWLAANSCSLPFKSEIFHLISDRCCLHHIDHSCRPEYAKEVTRILKPGGHILIRGSRIKAYEPFIPIKSAELKELFPESNFVHGPLLPIELVNASGGLTACIVLLTKRSEK